MDGWMTCERYMYLYMYVCVWVDGWVKDPYTNIYFQCHQENE